MYNTETLAKDKAVFVTSAHFGTYRERGVYATHSVTIVNLQVSIHV